MGVPIQTEICKYRNEVRRRYKDRGNTVKDNHSLFLCYSSGGRAFGDRVIWYTRGIITLYIGFERSTTTERL